MVAPCPWTAQWDGCNSLNWPQTWNNMVDELRWFLIHRAIVTFLSLSFYILKASLLKSIMRLIRLDSLSLWNYNFWAAPVPSTEKWSHEAIVTRSNLRPEQMQKLKVAANSGENPGFDFLQECWSDDPALQIVIKKVLAKFPQWGVAIVDGVLVH